MLTQLLRRIYRRLPLVSDIHDIQQNLHQLRNSMVACSAARFLDFNLSDQARYLDPLRLSRYQFQVCSQHGEDGIIREVFRRIGAAQRTFVEVGAGDGSQNNTAFLLSQGWSGCWIDGGEAFRRQLPRLSAMRDSLKCLAALVTRENIGALLRQLGVPKEFDLLSLDIDQNTYYAWEGVSDFRPRVVVVEYNAALPPDLEWKVAYDPGRTWDGTQNFGASLKSYQVLAERLGYCLVGCETTGTNAFFVRSDLVGEAFATPYTAENHYEPPRYFLGHRRGHRQALLDRNADG